MRALAGAQTYVSSHNMGSHIKVFVIWYMYTSEYMHVYNEVLTVSTRKGTDICEFAQHGVIHKSICNMKFVYLWVYLCRQRGSNCEQSQGHKHICVFAQRGFIYKTIHDTMYVYQYLWISVCKEVVSVSTHKGTNKCESAQHRLIYQRIRYMILDICILVSICMYAKRF